MPLSRDEVLHVARVYRIGLDDDEIEKLRFELADILAQFEVLGDVDTSAAEAAGSGATLSSVMREDIPAASFPAEEILRGAPVRDDDYFQVPVVLEEE
jgi:aspartyl-tRNA(Asn)/glutamyl-tRNA(Gln) amidotransferase subunit C